MIPKEWQIAWQRFRSLSAALHEQGITNLKQFLVWLRSSTVTDAIFEYLQAHPGLQGIIYWVAAFAVGVFAVSYAWLFAQCSLFAQSLLVQYPGALFVIAPAGFVLSWWLVWRFAPGAGGGGIPEVMVAIEADSEKASRWMAFRVGVVKFLSSLVCALGGGAIGREGPTIHIAASLFYTLGMPFKRIWPSLSHQSLLVAGGSAGIAAAFNTPLGGIVFAVEELSQQHFNRFKTFLISAVIIAGLVAQWLLGPYLYLGYPKLAAISFTVFPWAIAVGAVAGLAGGLFGKCLVASHRRWGRLSQKNHVKLAIGVGLCMATLGCLLGPEVLGGGSDLVTRVLFESDRRLSWEMVLGRFFAPLVSSAAGGASGLFAPALAAGAALGAAFSELCASSYPNLSVLLGMAAFLSGVTRAPFTAFVLVLEMTDRHSAIFPLMVASLVASLVAKLVDGKSCHERRCEGYLATLEPSEKAPLQKSV